MQLWRCAVHWQLSIKRQNVLKDWQILRDIQQLLAPVWPQSTLLLHNDPKEGAEMSLYVVVGAGPVGRETARMLAAEGNVVKLVSRSGTRIDAGPAGSVESIVMDARDGSGLARVCSGAQVIFMCAMAPYDKWPAEFPPIMDGVVTAAEKAHAKLVVLGNVYGYGAAARSPLTAETPLSPTSEKGRTRGAMWARARSSQVPALEIRASDYLGYGAASLFTLMALPPLLAGQKIVIPADLDALHGWSFTKDVARTLVAAARYSGEWGRAFHVPSRHASVREVAQRFAALASVQVPDLHALSAEDVTSLARENPFMRELSEMAYLFRAPCVIDASDTESLLGVSASSLDSMILDTLRKQG